MVWTYALSRQLQSALVPDAESLRRFSKHLVNTRPPSNPRVAFPGCPLPSDLDILMSGTPNDTLTADDIAALRELREDLAAICERARARGIRITVDAEHRQVFLSYTRTLIMTSFATVGIRYVLIPSMDVAAQ